MADEQIEQSECEKDAAKKQALPDSVKINDNNAPIERSEYLKLVDSSKDIVKQYGETSYESFMGKVGSDGAFAQLVVSNLMSGNKDVVTGMHPDSPQELNVVGKVDRTESIAKKLPGTAADAIPPVNGVNT